MSCHAAEPKAVNASASLCNDWQSLRLRSEFLHLQATGESWVTPCFVLQAIQTNTQQTPEFGLTVTKKIGGAVVRNRVRRRLRAAIDAYPLLASYQGWKFVLIARGPALTIEFSQLQRDLLWAIKRITEKISHAQ